MADLTLSAVGSLLGVLSTAFKGEAKLLSGVEGNIQFIKDEMDSMNGFLLHLNKSGNDHDDQQRAWMKQVRDIAYVSQDCIELYNMYGKPPPCNGFWALVTYVPNWAKALLKKQSLANKIQELKDRVKDVGERRQRYGVTVPSSTDRKGRADAAGQGGGDEERDDFLRVLRPDEEAARAAPSKKFDISAISSLRRWISSAPFDKAIRKLPADLAPDARKIHGGLLKLKAGGDKAGDRRFQEDKIAVCMGMILRALYAFHQGPVGNTGELKRLTAAVDSDADDLPRRVMVFCYSELTGEEKSCLQYLAAFDREDSISRTSLVRRCAAERLVSEDKERQLTVEQRAERCFDELLFRGFLSPRAHGAAGKVKSCGFSDGSVKDFIKEICKEENFVGHGLPVHLQTQINIRDAALPHAHHLLPGDQPPLFMRPVMAISSGREKQARDPIKKMLRELDLLPSTYRLNVMDLGGCVGILRTSHLRRICKIPTLKYLSLRNTDVGRLPHQLQELRLLETLDIRQTNIQGSHTRRVFQRSLKHLLAGNINAPGDLSNVTVRIPQSVSKMTELEILSHVQVSRHHELRNVENLTKLRKLGVVLAGPVDEKITKDLLRAIGRLSGCLHSLSVKVGRPPINGRPTLDVQDGATSYSYPPPLNLVSLRVDGMRSSGLPGWVEGLKKLHKITLCNTLLTDQKLDALGNLPALVCLRLRHRSYNGSELAFRKPGGFPALRFLRIEGVLVINELSFQAGSAPALETIAWSSASPGGAADDDAAATVTTTTTVSVTGVKNLPRLREVELRGLREQYPSTLASDLKKHSNRPISFQRHY